jgi:nitrous oxidase accessory protein NosD
MKTYCVSSLLAVGLLLLSVASYGQIPISSVPYTITSPGIYVLANNLSYGSATGAAINVNSSNVTLNFGGHFLASTAASPNNSGVTVNQVQNVTIESGTVDGFHFGIYFPNGSGVANNTGHIVENMRITHSAFGVYVYYASGCLIQNNYINGFNTNYAVGVFVGQGGGNQLIRNRVLNCYDGIAVYSDSSLESNFVYNCAFGMDMDYSDKYRFNTTIGCATTFTFGTPLTDDNN